MKTIQAFLNQSAHDLHGTAGAYAPELRGRLAEELALPVVLFVFVLAGLAALAINI